MIKRISACFLAFCLLLGGVCGSALGESGAPLSKPTINTQPKDVTVKQGGKVNIALEETGATGITWRFYDPATDTTVLASEAAGYFKGLKVAGQNGDTLRLRNVPAELNGWQAYCTLSNKQGKVVTHKVDITVTDKKGNPLSQEDTAPTQAPEDPEEDAGEDESDEDESDEDEYGEDEYDGDESSEETPGDPDGAVEDGLTVTAVGCTLQYLNRKEHADGDKLSSLSFGQTYTNAVTGEECEAGSISFAVTATIPKGKSVSYWVIDGVKYKFDTTVKSIIIRDLTSSMTIEAVLKGGEAQTQLTEEEIKAAHLDESLRLTVVNGQMSFLKSSGKAAGGSYTEFDFSDPYTNPATKQEAEGGTITVKVTSKLSGGKKPSSWLFNGVSFTFGAKVKSFTVTNLNVTMTYEAVK